MVSKNFNRQTWAWSVDAGDAASKLVLLFLAERADGTDFLAWPKIQTIAEATGLSARTVKDRLGKLVEAEIIEDTGERKGRTNQTKVWRLLVDENDAENKPKGASRASLKGANVAPLNPKGCSSRTSKGANVAPLKGAALAPSYIEHSISDHSIGTQEVTPPADAVVVSQPKSVKQSPSENSQVWQAYHDAYLARYQTAPIRNAKVNSQIKKLVEMVGLERALRIASNFPFHPDAFYTKQMHPVGLMLQDCQKLNTELETGQVMTWQRAKQQERMGNAAASVQMAQQATQQFEQAEERF